MHFANMDVPFSDRKIKKKLKGTFKLTAMSPSSTLELYHSKLLVKSMCAPSASRRTPSPNKSSSLGGLSSSRSLSTSGNDSARLASFASGSAVCDEPAGLSFGDVSATVIPVSALDSPVTYFSNKLTSIGLFVNDCVGCVTARIF